MEGKESTERRKISNFSHILLAVTAGIMTSVLAMGFVVLWTFQHVPYNPNYRVGGSGELLPAGAARCPTAAIAFSRSRFREVEIGMAEGEVIELLGEPLGKGPDYRDKNTVRWGYTTLVVSAHDHFRHDILFRDGVVVGKEVERSLDI